MLESFEDMGIRIESKMALTEDAPVLFTTFHGSRFGTLNNLSMPPK